MQHFGELFRLKLKAGNALEVNGAAVVLLNDLRFDIGPAGVRRGIYVSDETHGRYFLAQIGREGSHHISVFIQVHLNAHGLEFIPEHLEQVPLLGGRRLGFRFLVTLRVYADIA